MRTERATIYVCECCNKKFVSTCLAHEQKCFEAERQREEYARHSDEAQQAALKLARADGALRVLTTGGYEDTAVQRAAAILDGLTWKPIGPGWWAATMDQMIEAATEAAEEATQ